VADVDAGHLAGRTAVVTGAGSGLGRATAQALAAAGATVWCLDREASTVEETAATIEAAGGVARARAVDVTRAAEVDAAADEAAAANGIAVWVNSAGIMRFAKVVDLGEAELDAVMAVNFKGTVFGAQAAARRMVAAGSGGAIVNVASAILDGPQPRMAAYGASKAAVSHFSRTLALEVGKHGVRVNVIAPGWTRTTMTESELRGADGELDEAKAGQTEAMYASFTPLRRVAEPTDVATTVLWLASAAGSFITGQTIRPHGGVTMPW
jgi:NAD(P)-dependent dehydrogenase (short-subunit alcohol dehydrogenase family)